MKNYLTELFANDEKKDATQIKYPKKPNRYFRWGLNYNRQPCLTDKETELLDHIAKQYQSLSENKHVEVNPFTVKLFTKFYDLWQCSLPTLTALNSRSFTLPNREVKDANTFPLWRFADNTARQIANWQGERTKDQNVAAMNDPAMLVFEELKNWFFNILAQRGCKKEDLEFIAERQSYIKHILHELPDFGPDRLYLYELNNRLDEASRLVEICIANKQLPDLLADTIIKGKSLETTIGSYLHFLLIDEEVSDNFSYEFIENTPPNCHLSPLCKAYASSLKEATSGSTYELSKYDYLNRFYDFFNINHAEGSGTIHIKLKDYVLDNIKFADFVSGKDKENYLEALANLESLVQIRKTLENFKAIQSNVGSYIFAERYLTETNQLAANYIALINRTQTQLIKLLVCANSGLVQVLRKPHSKANHSFLKNLRALDTQFAQDTTATKQLEAYCAKTESSMNAYKEEMKKLANNLETGIAAHEVGDSMQKLVQQIHQLNTFIPAQLDKTKLAAELNAISLDMKTLNDPKPLQIDVKKDEDQVVNDVQASSRNYIDLTMLKPSLKVDNTSGRLIYVFNFHNQKGETGTLELYDQPFICLSPDKKQNNIVNQTGIFSQYKLAKDMTIEQVCDVLPPSLFDKAIIASKNGAIHGLMRGGCNLIGMTFKKIGYSQKLANFISQMGFYGSVFTLNFYQFYLQQEEKDVSEDCIIASLYKAALATGQTWACQFVFSAMGSLFNIASKKLTDWQWQRSASGVNFLGNMMKYGMFAVNAHEKGFIPAASSVVSGAIAQNTLEGTFKYFQNQH